MSGPDAIAEALRRAGVVARHMAERAADADRDGRFCAADLAELREAGLLGFLVPRRLGGTGATFVDYVELAMVLGEASGPSALVFNMHASVTGALSLTTDALASALGAGEQYFEARDEILRRAATGGFYAVAMSEKGAGSRLSDLRTSYSKSAGGYRLSGEKSFVSGAYLADAFLVAARAKDSPETVSYFLVPCGEGVVVKASWDALGMRATSSDDVSFDLEVPDAALIGGREGLALLVARFMPQWLVASYSAVYVGIAKAAIKALVEHCKGRHLERLPAVRARLGRADATVFGAASAVRQAARLVDEAPATSETNRAIYAAKLLAGEAAKEVASSMLEGAGASALRRGSSLERLYRDAICGVVQPASSDVCADWLGVAALGGDPESDTEVPRW